MLLKKLQNLAKREASGALSGKQLVVGKRSVRVDKLLGEGGFATIYRCTDVDTGETFALKHFILTGYPDAARDADKEVAIMERLAGCPCAVRLHEAQMAGPPGAPTAAYALMDFCPDTLVSVLHQAQQRGQALDDSEVLGVVLPVARAVQAMHNLSPPLAHRDLKAENVLLGPEGRWVLCDFGSASMRHGVLESAHEIALEEEVVRKYTTPAYRAPELYDLYAREYIGPPVDIWALGVLLYLLAFGRLPFEGEAKLQVLNGRFTMPEGRPPPLRALIKDLLVVSPRQRPSIHEVLARLACMAPPQLLEEFPDMQQELGQGQQAQQLSQQAQTQTQQAVQARLPGRGAEPTAHEHVPAQGWADFATQAAIPNGGGAAAGHTRKESGSGSWATFSPKKGEELGPAPAAGAAAGVGSFWSSFGEETPSEAQEQGLLAGLAVEPARQQHAPNQQQQQQQQQQAAPEPPKQRQPQRAPPLPSQQPSRTEQQAITLPASTPPAPQAGPPQPLGTPADVSPLSAGLTRMTAPYHAQASASKPPATATAAQPRPSGPATAPGLQAAAACASRAAPARSGKNDSAGEAEGLRQHCRVLEELLQSRNEEVQRLQLLVKRQGGEIKELRQQLQAAASGSQGDRPQQPGAGGGLAGEAAAGVTQTPAGTGAAAPFSTPGSSRLAQELRLQVPGSAAETTTPTGSVEGGSWVSFGTVGGQGDAPTPTLLQPAGGSSFTAAPGSQQAGGGSRDAAPAAGAGAGARPEALAAWGGGMGSAGSSASGSGNVAAPLETVLRANLDLNLWGSSSRSSLAHAGSAELRQAPMRHGSSGTVGAQGTAPGSAASGNGGGSGQQGPSLRSFLVQATPTPSPPGDGTRSAPTSALPSPVRTLAAMGLSGTRSPMQPGSPMAPRGSGGSPNKHRRHLTAPDGNFFDDLNPL